MSLTKFGRSLSASLALTLMLSASSANAWDGSVSGTIANFDVAPGGNYGFRISLAGYPTMCNGGSTWAYLIDSDSNYKVFVAALMLAKAQGNKVTVYSNLQGAFCHIGYISYE